MDKNLESNYSKNVKKFSKGFVTSEQSACLGPERRDQHPGERQGPVRDPISARD